MLKKLKKISILTLLFVYMGSGFTYAEDPINIIVNNKLLKVDDQAVLIENGRTLVPLRPIFEALGLKVNWDGQTRTVKGSKGEKTIVLKIDDKKAKVDNREISLDVPAKIINSNTVVPTRFVAESIGADVQWHKTSRSVLINSKIEDSKNPIKIVGNTSYCFDGKIIEDYRQMPEKFPKPELIVEAEKGKVMLKLLNAKDFAGKNIRVTTEVLGDYKDYNHYKYYSKIENKYGEYDYKDSKNDFTFSGARSVEIIGEFNPEEFMYEKYYIDIYEPTKLPSPENGEEISFKVTFKYLENEKSYTVVADFKK